MKLAKTLDYFYICKDLTEGEINQSINQSM